jgi:hypothetical protein
MKLLPWEVIKLYSKTIEPIEPALGGRDRLGISASDVIGDVLRA